MIVLGIDPGLAIVGYGVISFENNKDIALIDYGTIETPAKTKVSQRLSSLALGMNELVNKFAPDAIAFEELFFNTNQKTAINVAQARGVLVHCASLYTQELYEYTPLQVKQSVVGYGRAEKEQVQLMVKTICNLKTIPKPDDAADALAVAICHINSYNVRFDSRIK